MIKPVEDWKRVLERSISLWMQVVGLLVLIVPEGWYAWTGIDVNPALLWWGGILLLVVGIVGRLVQQNYSRWWQEWLRLLGIAAIVAALAFVLAGQAHAQPPSEEQTLAIAVPFIAQEEGKRNEAYLDVVGVPTICYGSTRGVHLGMRKTDAQCTALLRAEVAEYREGLHAYFTPATIAGRLTPRRDTAYTSLAFNAGIRAIGRSTATRRLNAGDIKGGCQALGWWNKAGGRVIRGLVLRRGREIEHCMAGLR